MDKLKPVFIIIVLVWMVFLVDLIFPYEFNKFGIIPRKLIGLRGVLCAPFLHANLSHILSNSLPFLVLGTVTHLYYSKNALMVFIFSVIISGLLVWLFARPSIHVGMSGVIYAYASFLIFAGFYTRKFWGIVISVLVVVLYGSLVWGLLPRNPYISWEGHLAGAIAGYLLAFAFYRKTKK